MEPERSFGEGLLLLFVGLCAGAGILGYEAYLLHLFLGT